MTNTIGCNSFSVKGKKMPVKGKGYRLALLDNIYLSRYPYLREED
jgi:hypothetical protein